MNLNKHDSLNESHKNDEQLKLEEGQENQLSIEEQIQQFAEIIIDELLKSNYDQE